jgi:sterol desaturase/sphingolipid hydroxylase (fatty acid hydroxylase superfamily)
MLEPVVEVKAAAQRFTGPGLLKSRVGIPRPRPRPKEVDLAQEARIARRRFYPVTVVYTVYALTIFALGLRANPATALFCLTAGVIFWTLLEYLVHRHLLHGVFPDGKKGLQHFLHVWLDNMHADHHERPWDGMHVNGRFDTVPAAVILVAASFAAPLPTWPVFVAALLQCYVIEEWVHYSVHFHQFRSAYFEAIRKHHLFHHSARGAHVAFGLSNTLWDAPLGTPAPPPFGPEPRRVRRRAPRTSTRPRTR